MKIYFSLALLTFIYFVFYLGLYLPSKKQTYLVIRKRLRNFDNGNLSNKIDSTPDEILYMQAVLTAIIASILFPIEIVGWIIRKIKKLFK